MRNPPHAWWEALLGLSLFLGGIYASSDAMVAGGAAFLLMALHLWTYHGGGER